MRALATYQVLSTIDARSIARDSLLRWIAILTPAIGLLFRYAIPAGAVALERQFGLDLADYYPLIMSFLPIAVAGMIGTVIGFLLLDQRDDQTMTALLVTPVSLADYLRYRMSTLIVACIALSCVTMLLAGLTETTALQLIVTSIVAAPLAPIYALFLGSMAGNKVQGFALIKVLGIVVVPCIVAYFVTGPWQSAFGIIPHYWSLKVYWLFDMGAIGRALAYSLFGLVWQAVLLALLARRFAQVVRR